jgi:hypothetical protein
MSYKGYSFRIDMPKKGAVFSEIGVVFANKRGV